MKKVVYLRLAGVLLLLALPVGVGAWAVNSLRSQQLSGCMSLDEGGTQADDSVAATLYCAQASAGQQTIDGLSEAIRLARLVPSDHPLEAQSLQLVEQASQKLLELAENSFQAGNLEEAIGTARRIPAITAAYKTADERIKEWQSAWDKAQSIYTDAQASADRDQWDQAFGKARELRQLGNRYWDTDRYQELVQKIQEAKEGKAAQAKAERDSQKASQARYTAQPDIMSNWQQDQAREATEHLKRARRLASAGTPEGLRAATDAAGMVLYGTPQYEEAQRLVDRWNHRLQDLEDRPYLARAMQLASKGDLPSLQAAIAEASNVSFGSALYQEAQDKIGQWTDAIQKLHSQAYPETSGGRQVSPANYAIPPVRSNTP
ncbi:hypothetical protein [Stenomitos frigidus]|uniref:Chromosome segregation ATPase n=1 Tax=Stenomitos frigidus ULC18 TaxID=2107698 RepID=A0A2T1E4Y8_9CYAN|nr:hypothetical protein [Stenomitos frigidus]PSB27813.1 hypothetical protein C7B82_15630 [Stenomitos frigidus ULC18]